MTKPRFPATLESDVDDLERRLRILERSGGVSTVVSGGNVPVGTIVAYWGSGAPAGWLVCNGGSFSAGTYPDLATLLGGTTLPNLKGRVVVGIDAAQTEFDTLGETGGSKTIAAADLAAHTHTVNDPQHSHVNAGHSHTVASHNHGGGTGVHAHGVFGSGGSVGTHAGSHGHDGATDQLAGPPNSGGFFDGSAHTTSTVGVGNTFETPGTDTRADTIATDGTGITVTGGGPGTAGGKLPPYIALSYIIKAV